LTFEAGAENLAHLGHLRAVLQFAAEHQREAQHTAVPLDGAVDVRHGHADVVEGARR